MDKAPFLRVEPGLLCGLFIAAFLAKETYRYADRESRDLFDFIRNEICRPGGALAYEAFLEKVLP